MLKSLRWVDNQPTLDVEGSPQYYHYMYFVYVSPSFMIVHEHLFVIYKILLYIKKKCLFFYIIFWND
jgi:hypothetical protein